MQPLSDDVVSRAAPLIARSLQRSNPDGLTVADVLAEIEAGNARLWLGPDSAAVTQFLQSARISLDELIWHAGGTLQGIEQIIDYGGKACRMAGCDRLVLLAGEGDTRRGWSRVLTRFGFRPQTILEKEL